MTRIEKYGIFCRSWEGGWSNHPNDKGGATMRGVTYTTFCNFRKAKGLPKPSLLDLKNISDKEWNSVLRWHTWDKLRLDELKSEWIAFLIADCCWMSGAGYVKRIQGLYGLKQDGIVVKRRWRSSTDLTNKRCSTHCGTSEGRSTWVSARGLTASF